MSQRFIVCDNDQPFASVHAETAEEAIATACQKVDGHNPQTCTATTIPEGPDAAKHGEQAPDQSSAPDFPLT